jgi:hypothetical protein
MPKFTKEDVVTLDRRQIYLSLMIDGVGSAPFSAVTIPPIEAPPVSYREQIVEASREQFTAPREGVEKAVIDELVESAASPAPFDARMKKKPVEHFPHPPFHQPLQKESETQKETEVRHFVPHHPHQTTTPPIVTTKTVEDLKAILRTMTEKNSAEKEHKHIQNQQSLKGTLAEVIEKNMPASPELHRGEMKVAPTPAGVGVPTESVGKEKKPFEVPENTLRKVLKGES